MTPPLLPCPACDRHVRVTENACPFCEAPLPRRAGTRQVVPSGRLGSLAVFTFRAAALGAALSACGGDATDDDGAAGGAGKHQQAGTGGTAGTPGDDLGGSSSGARAGANPGGAPSFAGAPTDGGAVAVYRATPKG